MYIFSHSYDNRGNQYRHKVDGQQCGSPLDRAGKAQGQPQCEGQLNAAGEQGQQEGILQGSVDVDGFAGKKLHIVFEADKFRGRKPVPLGETVRKGHDDRGDQHSDKQEQCRQQEQKNIYLVLKRFLHCLLLPYGADNACMILFLRDNHDEKGTAPTQGTVPRSPIDQ